MAENINFPSKVVIDASIALAFLLPDEQDTRVDALFLSAFLGKAKILIPSILYFEVGNGLRSACLRKRIKAPLAEKLLANFLKIPLEIKDTDWRTCFKTALKENISFYDAAYVTLARKERIPFLTLDKLLSSS